MLTWEYPPRVVGGVARVVHDLSHRLIKDGHEVTVITYNLQLRDKPTHMIISENIAATIERDELFQY